MRSCLFAFLGILGVGLVIFLWPLIAALGRLAVAIIGLLFRSVMALVT